MDNNTWELRKKKIVLKPRYLFQSTRIIPMNSVNVQISIGHAKRINDENGKLIRYDKW